MRGATAPTWLRRASVGLWILVGLYATWTVGHRLVWPSVSSGVTQATRDTNLALADFTNVWNSIVDGFGLSTARIDSYWVLDEATFVVAAAAFAAGTILLVAVLASTQPGHRRDKFIRGAKLKGAPTPIGRLFTAKAGGGQLSVGGVPIPRAAEVEHILLSGATGTGKSTVMDSFLPKIRERGDRCFVIDLDGSFYARHGLPGDLILNPYDARSVQWSPFAELVSDEDYRRIAEAMIPPAQDGGLNGDWIQYGQGMVADLMRVMKQEKDLRPRQLHHWLTAASPQNLGDMLQGTTSAVLADSSNEKFLGSVRGVTTPYIGYLDLLTSDVGGFSVGQWIRDESNKGWLFLTYRQDQQAKLGAFLSCVAAIAMLEALSLPESRDRRLFFMLDELATLGPLNRVPDTLTKLRKHGGCVVLAVQVLAQLRAVYGADMAQAIVGNAGTKIILRQGDAETAKAWEAQLGEHEVRRWSESTSSNDSGNDRGRRRSRGRSFGEQVVREPVMLASELMAMPNLQGVLMRAGRPHQRFNYIDNVGMPTVNKGYLARGAGTP